MAKYQDGWYWVQEYEGAPWEVLECKGDRFHEPPDHIGMEYEWRDDQMHAIGPRIPAPDEQNGDIYDPEWGRTGGEMIPEPARKPLPEWQQEMCRMAIEASRISAIPVMPIGSTLQDYLDAEPLRAGGKVPFWDDLDD